MKRLVLVFGMIGMALSVISAPTRPREDKKAATAARDEEREAEHYKQAVLKWNQDNKGKVSFKLETGKAIKLVLWPGLKHEEHALGLTGIIENKSDDKIAAVIVDIALVREGQTVIKHRYALKAEVFPTVTFRFDGNYVQEKRELGTAIWEVHRAIDQLKDNYRWSYAAVAVIPESLSYGEYRFWYPFEVIGTLVKSDQQPL